MSATNGWKTSWKKFLIELAYLKGLVVLYPNFPNQSSFSTNHLEAGMLKEGRLMRRIESYAWARTLFDDAFAPPHSQESTSAPR